MPKGVSDSPSQYHPESFFEIQTRINRRKHGDHFHSFFVSKGSVYLQTIYPNGELIEIKVPPNEIGELSLYAYILRIPEEMPLMSILHRPVSPQNPNLEEKQRKKACSSDSDNADETIASDTESDENTLTDSDNNFSSDDSESDLEESASTEDDEPGYLQNR